MRSYFITAAAIFFGSAAWAIEPLTPTDREAVLAKLKANKVSLGGLTIEPKDGGPLINLGTGLGGGEASNATDEKVKQPLFCKCRDEQAGHLAFMFR